MKTSTRAIEFIKRKEVLRLKVYDDAAGHATIGWGHLVKSNECFTLDITKAEAEKIFTEDIVHAEGVVQSAVEVGLTQGQFDALVSFVFNLGERHFQESTVLRRVNAGDHLGVPFALIMWNRAAGKTLRGLLIRRLEESLIYLS